MATKAVDDPPDSFSKEKSTTEKELRKKKEDDAWAIVMDEQIDYVKFKDLTSKQKVGHIFRVIGKIIGVLLTLYLFICSLSLMSSAFQILGGKTGGQLFTHEFLSNPITGLIVGILVTVLVQSSSTSTSIVTTMVGAGILQVHEAIPIIMGANIGTSVTNTIVALTQSADREKFRKSFGGATVLDMFNFLSVLILLPIEVLTGYLETVTGAIIDNSGLQGGQSGGPELLDAITDPLTEHVVQVNKTIITLIAQSVPLEDDASMISIWCKYNETNVTMTYVNSSDQCQFANLTTGPNCTLTTVMEVGYVKCTINDFLFANTGMSDPAVGSILLVLSLVTLTTCLILMVKLLSSMLKGSVAKIIKKIVNTNFPFPFGWVSGYLAIIVGALLTFLVQSSSVFTSTITPLVGLGIISLKRMYPLTLGANIGTTATAILAALATESDAGVAYAMQIALCHFFFNITGIAIWYPIPILRRVPIRAAMFLGNTTGEYRWFAVLYLISAFFVIPGALLGLSFAGRWVLGGFLILTLVIILAVIAVNVLQTRKPNWLPKSMRTWDFLPMPLHSLEPYDKFFTKTLLCCKSCQEEEELSNDQDTMSTSSVQFDNETEPPPYDNNGSGLSSTGYQNHTFEKDYEISTAF